MCSTFATFQQQPLNSSALEWKKEEFLNQQDKDLPVAESIDYWKFIAFAETWAQENEYALDTPPIPPPHMIESEP